jgi:hypothetical protein
MERNPRFLVEVAVVGEGAILLISVSFSRCGSVSAVPVALLQYGTQPVTSNLDVCADAYAGERTNREKHRTARYLIKCIDGV